MLDTLIMRRIIIGISVVLGLFLLAQTFVAVRSIRTLGLAPMVNTITVSGRGEVSLAPDLATVSFSVQKISKTVTEANAQVTADVEKVLSAIKALGVESKDIQTSNYSIYPEYTYERTVCTVSYCPTGKSVLTGYNVSKSVNIKIRNLDKAGDVLTALAQQGATNVSGLNFGFDNKDKPKEEARAKAIESAQEKAKILAEQLDVDLIAVMSFSESGDYYMPYARSAIGLGGDMMNVKEASVPVEIGQNTVSSEVSITYQIR